jgi:hypothetical protein
MTIMALRAVLNEAEELYRTAGDKKAAAALREFSSFLTPYDSKSVDAFVKLAAKAGS